RRHGRVAAGVHPGGRRIRDSLIVRPRGSADDCAPAGGRVLPQPRLAQGERGGDRDAVAAGRADHGFPALPEQGTRGPEAMRTQGMFSKVMLGFGLAFLYVPILSMIVFSFNDSRSVTVWNSVTSPTLKWYSELFRESQV